MQTICGIADSYLMIDGLMLKTSVVNHNVIFDWGKSIHLSGCMGLVFFQFGEK